MSARDLIEQDVMYHYYAVMLCPCIIKQGKQRSQWLQPWYQELVSCIKNWGAY